MPKRVLRREPTSKRILDGIDDKTKKAGITDADFDKLGKIDFSSNLSMLANAKYLNEMKPKMEQLAKDYNEVAVEHIDSNLKGVSFQQDLTNTVKNDKDGYWVNAKQEETKPMSGGIMEAYPRVHRRALALT